MLACVPHYLQLDNDVSAAKQSVASLTGHLRALCQQTADISAMFPSAMFP